MNLTIYPYRAIEKIKIFCECLKVQNRLSTMFVCEKTNKTGICGII